MKYWLALIVGVALILALSWFAHAECANSGRAVLAGGASHATWRLVDGRKCWFAGRPMRKAAMGTRTVRAFGAVNETVRVPLPRPNPLDAPRPGMYEAEVAQLLNLMWFSPLAHRGADW